MHAGVTSQTIAMILHAFPYCTAKASCCAPTRTYGGRSCVLEVFWISPGNSNQKKQTLWHELSHRPRMPDLVPDRSGIGGDSASQTASAQHRLRSNSNSPTR
ncbi:hypothetical protein PYCCODRAFT_938783 [Trametes coccinea BRFM310]|uniref:Secreted protein n=1 Tax=Trametes coccinea (strain BRFM310) TaxID=1353009 RepID=A0A1Y2IZE0_TRAC3|nr:hypothetical protein PYCCODRAFT_938783 [Trametes coccinea BRFM310]